MGELREVPKGVCVAFLTDGSGKTCGKRAILMDGEDGFCARHYPYYIAKKLEEAQKNAVPDGD